MIPASAAISAPTNCSVTPGMTGFRLATLFSMWAPIISTVGRAGTPSSAMAATTPFMAVKVTVPGAAITVGKFDQKPTPGIYGGDGNDYLDGQGGNDFIDGGTGADFMVGGFGNDTFIADNSGDSAFEGAGGGFDTVIASASFSLSAASDVEQILTSDANLTTALNLTGSSIANTITGNAGVNTLKGAAGNDILTALAGNDILDGGLDKDQLFGGDGNDKLFGNAGSDKLTGGKGKDTFVFNTAPDKSTNVDKILDFKSVDDTIQIDNKYFKTVGGNGKLKAEVLAFGKKALEKDDHLIYDQSIRPDIQGLGRPPGPPCLPVSSHIVKLFPICPVDVGS